MHRLVGWPGSICCMLASSTDFIVHISACRVRASIKIQPSFNTALQSMTQFFAHLTANPPAPLPQPLPNPVEALQAPAAVTAGMPEHRDTAEGPSASQPTIMSAWAAPTSNGCAASMMPQPLTARQQWQAAMSARASEAAVSRLGQATVAPALNSHSAILPPAVRPSGRNIAAVQSLEQDPSSINHALRMQTAAHSSVHHSQQPCTADLKQAHQHAFMAHHRVTAQATAASKVPEHSGEPHHPAVQPSAMHHLEQPAATVDYALMEIDSPTASVQLHTHSHQAQCSDQQKHHLQQNQAQLVPDNLLPGQMQRDAQQAMRPQHAHHSEVEAASASGAPLAQVLDWVRQDLSDFVNWVSNHEIMQARYQKSHSNSDA